MVQLPLIMSVSLSCTHTPFLFLSPPETWMEKPAFGTALEEHLKRSNREIALPLEACVMMLLETGMKEEVMSFIKDLKSRSFKNSVPIQDPH